MKKIYLENHNNIVIDENDNLSFMEHQSNGIDWIYRIPEDAELFYKSGEETKKVSVKKDDIVIQFYKRNYLDDILIIKSPEWIDRLNKIEEYEKEYALKQGECCDCENCCKNC